MVTLAGICTIVVFLGCEAAYAQYLTRYRKDIEPGTPFWRGASLGYQRNAYSPENYQDSAHGKLRVLWLCRLGQVVGSVMFVVGVGTEGWLG